MSLLDKFPGAEVVAGDVIFNRKTVVQLRHGQELLTPDGEAALKQIDATIDVEAKVVSVEPDTGAANGVVTPPVARKRASKQVAAPEAPTAGAETPPSDPSADLDSLLNT